VHDHVDISMYSSLKITLRNEPGFFIEFAQSAATWTAVSCSSSAVTVSQGMLVLAVYHRSDVFCKQIRVSHSGEKTIN